MNALLALAVLFAWENNSPVPSWGYVSSPSHLSFGHHQPGLSLVRRSLWDLHKMITKATGRNALLHYSSYGCYCGLGGRGQPKDATDRCCQLHDTCYDSLLSYGCNAKTQGYSYNWHGRSPSCRKGSWCAQLSCECDRSLALCLKQNVRSYSKRYRFYLKHRCR